MNVVLPGLKDRRVAKVGESFPHRNHLVHRDSHNCCIPSGYKREQLDSVTVERPVRLMNEINSLAIQVRPSDNRPETVRFGRNRLQKPVNAELTATHQAHFCIGANGDTRYLIDVAYPVDECLCPGQILINFQVGTQIGAPQPSVTNYLPNLSRETIIAGRRLVTYFCSSLPTLNYISLSSAPAAFEPNYKGADRLVRDLWLNIGAWAVDKLGLFRGGETNGAHQNGNVPVASPAEAAGLDA